MFKVIKKEIVWGNDKLTIETGRIARQSDGAVLVTMNETTVLATVVAHKKAKEGIDFMPLTVHYKEMTYAAGKIPGGFFKREGRPSEKEVLTSRLIDRPFRPNFSDGFYHETQVICTLLSHDLNTQPDIVALIAVSAAIAISGVPVESTLAAARVGYVNNEFVLNPKSGEEIQNSALDLIVAGSKDSVLMVESEAKELSEQIMLDAIAFGQKSYAPIIDMINEFASECSKKQISFTNFMENEPLYEEVSKLVKEELASAYNIKAKQERRTRLEEIRSDIHLKLESRELPAIQIDYCLKKIEKEIVRKDIMIASQLRIDGRKFDEIRDILAEVQVLPRVHGSCLFTRGETQALAVTTLGTGEDSQLIDALEGEYKERFMLHYNFPPYSVGEATPLRATSRREIGHGKLAWRALSAVMPSKEEFPYTVRVVSEITESNGSSSMATVCAGVIAMLDAGVPLKSSVAGIAMGLILENKDFIVLSDISGDEDHLGDMDFKVAGTLEGITALQMDIKVKGITHTIMTKALAQAKDGREHILAKMAECLDHKREEVSVHAPTLTTIKIATDKIRDIIGSGGKVIKGICEASEAKIEIEDDGTIRISSRSVESKDKALAMIAEIIQEPEIGKTYEGKVVKIVEFGAFVNFFGKKEGLLHISEIANESVKKVTDFIQEGQVIKVKLLGIDNKGKVKLSMKALLNGNSSPVNSTPVSTTPVNSAPVTPVSTTSDVKVETGSCDILVPEQDTKPLNNDKKFENKKNHNRNRNTNSQNLNDEKVEETKPSRPEQKKVSTRKYFN